MANTIEIDSLNCPIQGGPNAASTVLDTFNTLLARADEVFSDAIAAAEKLAEIDFPSINNNVRFDANSQLAFLAERDRPDLDYSLLDYQSPTVPTVPTLDTGFDWKVDAGLPTFNEQVIACLGSQLIRMACDGFGVNPKWEQALWSRTRDRQSRIAEQAVDTITGEFSRRNWTLPQGVEIGRIDLARNEAWRNLSEANRQIMLQAWQLAYQAAVQGASLAQSYLTAWVQAYTAEVGAEAARASVQFRQNSLRLQTLSAEIAIFQAQNQSEQTRLTSVSSAFGTEAQLDASDTGYAQAVSQRDIGAFGVDTEQGRLSAEYQLRAHEIDMAERRRDLDQTQLLAKSETDLKRQIGASCYQAMSVGSAISNSSSNTSSTTCGTSWTYNYGETNNVKAPDESQGT